MQRRTSILIDDTVWSEFRTRCLKKKIPAGYRIETLLRRDIADKIPDDARRTERRKV